jgi:predicted secreted hydrolase
MRRYSPSPASAGEGWGEGLLLFLLSCLLVVTSSIAQAQVEYPPVVPGLELQFPRDEGSHPDFRIEWWYVTGWIDATDSKVRAPRGFQVTFFRVRTGIATDNPSGFAPRQVLFAHAALADPAPGRLRHAQRSARVGFDLAYAREGNLDVRLDDWSLRQSQPGRYVTTVHGEEFAFELTLESTQPPLLQGDDGFSRKGPSPRAASYYYSLPQLAVSGTITVDGRPQIVTGQAWFDHEWSSDYVDAQAQGWDWLGVNLHDGGALMAFRMHDANGGERWASAKLRSPGGTPVEATHDPDQVEWTPLATWRSPRTGVVYPIRWRVQVGDRRYLVEPLLEDAELDSRPSTGILYWEGPIRLLDEASGKELGRGYLELTGYGGKLDL